MLKAIIFDLDDTLLDWSLRTQDWLEYEQSYLTLVFGYLTGRVEVSGSVDDFVAAVRRLTQEAWLESRKELIAPNFLTILEKAFDSVGITLNRLDIDARLQTLDWELIGGVAPFADVVELLPVLESHHIKIGMITNAHFPMWMRDRELRSYGLLPYFADCRLASSDFGYLKPHPAIFRAAMDCLDVRPDEAVFVGDSPEADMAGARAVGMRGVLRIGPHSAAKTNDAIAPDAIAPDGVINTLHELIPLLDSWYPGWRTINASQHSDSPGNTGDSHGIATARSLS